MRTLIRPEHDHLQIRVAHNVQGSMALNDKPSYDSRVQTTHNAPGALAFKHKRSVMRVNYRVVAM
jgi:hypothetical protein